MKITIPNPTLNNPTPKHNPWMIAEGSYRAVLKQVKPQAGKLRFVFSVTVPGCAYASMAGKNYLNDLSMCSALRNDLICWRGHDLTPEEYQAGSIDTNALLGRPADIQIGHIDNDGYGQPFVYIKAIFPPGALVRTE